MKLGKKVVSLILTIMMVTALFSCVTVSAASSTDDIEMKVTPTAAGLDVSVVAKTNLEIGGLELTVTKPEGASYTGYTSAFSTVTPNPETGVFSFSNGATTASFSNGDSLFTLHYSVAEYSKSETYSFSLEFTEAYGEDEDTDLSFVNETLSVDFTEGLGTFTVTFDSNGGTTVAAQTGIEEGEKATKPVADPEKVGYTFDCWTLDGREFNFNTPIIKDITLVAHYNKDTVSPEDLDLSDVVKIEKNLDTADVVYIDAETFTFTFTKTDDSPSDTPAIPAVTINYAGGEGAQTLTSALGTITFPRAGTYKYTVAETAGTTAGMAYDTNTYTLYITVVENAMTGELELASDGIKIVSAETDGEGNNKKSDKLSFTNTVEKTGSLTISKTVVGSPDENKDYEFTITFSEGFEGKVDGTDTTFTTGAYTFTLKNSEITTISDIPAGLTYTLTETAYDNYTASALVVSDGKKNEEVNGTYGAGLTISDKKIGDEENKVDITNVYSITAPATGLTFSNEMLVMLGLVIIAVAGGVVISRKVKKARE